MDGPFAGGAVDKVPKGMWGHRAPQKRAKGDRWEASLGTRDVVLKEEAGLIGTEKLALDFATRTPWENLAGRFPAMI